MFDAIRNRFAGHEASLHFIDKDFGLRICIPRPKYGRPKTECYQGGKTAKLLGRIETC